MPVSDAACLIGLSWSSDYQVDYFRARDNGIPGFVELGAQKPENRRSNQLCRSFWLPAGEPRLGN